MADDRIDWEQEARDLLAAALEGFCLDLRPETAGIRLSSVHFAIAAALREAHEAGLRERIDVIDCDACGERHLTERGAAIVAENRALRREVVARREWVDETRVIIRALPTESIQDAARRVVRERDEEREALRRAHELCAEVTQKRIQAERECTAATARAERAERVAEERENIIKAQATELHRARDRRDEAIKRTDVAETRLSRLRERGVQITGRVCSPISDDAIYYAEMLGLVVEDRDVLRTKLTATEQQRDRFRDALAYIRTAVDVAPGGGETLAEVRRVVAERDSLHTLQHNIRTLVMAGADESTLQAANRMVASLRDLRDVSQGELDRTRSALKDMEKERDKWRKDAQGGSAGTRPILGADEGEPTFAAALRVTKERDSLRSKVEQRDSVIRTQDAEIGRLRGRTDTAECRFVQEQRRADEVDARSSKLEAALGQTEKELHECRIALKEALGGLDSVKDQNADLRRQLRRLQTGTEIESDRLTDVELNLQATVDRITAERDKAINDRNAVLRL